ncbi:MAG: polysaccharide deacetylase [Planctomycetaceae bacterium]|nr:polysaccharide deacetylase [Planctomycetaceae bacterium]
MNPLRQAIKFTMTGLLPRQKWLVNGPRSANGIALTFDDGPHPEFTPRLLDELQRQGVAATFFVVGDAAARYPELVRRMAVEGHAVGTHSYTHSEPRQTCAKQLLNEVRRSLDLCGNLIGYEPTLFRPPKGQLTLAKTLGLWKLKQTVVLWNQDPRDYQGLSGIQSWLNQYQPRGGDIVLMHDIHPHCIAAIAPLVRLAEARQLTEFVRVDQWIQKPKREVSDLELQSIQKT